MKTVTKLVGNIALVAIIGFTMAACDDGNGGGSVDTALNGTWGLTQEDMSYEFFFNNGSFKYSMNNTPYEKGTYITSGNKLTMKITHIYGKSPMAVALGIDLKAKWYTVTEFFKAYKTVLLNEGMTEEEWTEMEPMIQQQVQTGFIYTYSVSGNTLTLTMDTSQIEGTGTPTIITIILTRK